jgi:ribosome assembly protein 1
MISVEAGLLSNFHQVAGQLGITERSQEVFVAITRVFSGVLYAGKPLYVFGPKFQGLTSIQAANIDQLDLTQVEHVTQVASGLTKLYMLMGRELHALEKVPAGNIVGIIGLQDHVLKTATLSSTLKCPSLAKMPYQAKPIVRVAIEPEDPRNFEELEAGLQRLYRSDPTVEVQVQATGEHVIVALGELHLERCIKDLKERFAKVAVRVSPPLVGFRESILDGKISSLQESVVFKDILAAALEEKTSTDDQDDNEREDSTKDVKIAKGRTPDTSVTLKVRALPLPLQVSKLLEEHVDILRQLTSQQNLASTSERKIHEKEEQEEEMDISESAGVAASAEFSSGVNNLKKQLQQAFNSSEETFWHQLSLEKIWCFGPRRIGPNVLINNVDGYLASNSVFLALEQVAERAYQDQKECFEMLSKLENSLMTGFQLATAAGPLCDEPVWGVAFILEDFVYHPIDQSSAPLLAPVPSADQSSCTQSSSILAPNINNYGPLSGQVISCIKNTCRLAFVKQPVRLVEAIYECTVQCQSEQLGRLYSVINKRRGNVFQEELSDGTSLFTIKASLPVVESFGFATELLINTSGAASNPQLTFSHWSIIEDDPFFQPQTEEEREDYGERIYEHNYVRKYIDAVRKRKGLARDEKIVVHAEKQRTLARKK